MAGRRHHFIPRMILRNFADERGQLFFWRRGFPAGVIKRTAPENLFVETDLYSVVGDDGSRDDTVEDYFAELESVGADFMRQLFTIVRRGGTPNLDGDAWRFWSTFMTAHMKRSPAFMRKVAAHLGTWETIRVGLREAIEEGGAEAEQARSLLSDPVALQRFERNLAAQSLSDGPSAKLLDAFDERGMSVYVAPAGKSFIVGEIGFGRARVRSSYAITGSLSFVPVAPDIALGFAVERRRIGVAEVAPDIVRAMNEVMLAQSQTIAGASEELLRSLTKTIRSELPT